MFFFNAGLGCINHWAVYFLGERFDSRVSQFGGTALINLGSLIQGWHDSNESESVFGTVQTDYIRLSFLLRSNEKSTVPSSSQFPRSPDEHCGSTRWQLDLDSSDSWRCAKIKVVPAVAPDKPPGSFNGLWKFKWPFVDDSTGERTSEQSGTNSNQLHLGHLGEGSQRYQQHQVNPEYVGKPLVKILFT